MLSGRLLPLARLLVSAQFNHYHLCQTEQCCPESSPLSGPSEANTFNSSIERYFLQLIFDLEYFSVSFGLFRASIIVPSIQ